MIRLLLSAIGVLTIACVGHTNDDMERTYWVYEGGWFSKTKGDAWIEMNDDVYSKSEKPWQFTEANRTKDYVELYDANRKLTVRLSESVMAFRPDGEDKWIELQKGKWKQRK